MNYYLVCLFLIRIHNNHHFLYIKPYFTSYCLKLKLIDNLSFFLTKKTKQNKNNPTKNKNNPTKNETFNFFCLHCV